MPARKQAAPAEQRPPFWVASVPLPVGDEMGSGAPRAFNPGDRVPPGHVEQFGWQEHVELPPGDWTVTPAADDKPGSAGKKE